MTDATAWVRDSEVVPALSDKVRIGLVDASIFWESSKMKDDWVAIEQSLWATFGVTLVQNGA